MTKTIIETLIQLSLVGSGVSLLFMILKTILSKHLNVKTSYVLWIAILLFFVLPFEISIKNEPVQNSPSFTEIYQEKVYPVIHTNLEKNVFEPKPITQTTPIVSAVESQTEVLNSTLKLSDFVFIIWIFGIMLCALIDLTNYFRFKIKLKSTRTACNDDLIKLFNKEIEKQNIKQPLQIYHSNEVSSAILIGVLNPTIYLPNNERSMDQWSYILAHECRHQKNHDLIIKWFATIVSWIHFFNPIIHFVQNQINKDCEIACDYSITQRLSRENKVDYANTIVSMLQVEKHPAQSLTTSMTGSKKDVKKRITKISKKENRKAMIFVTSILVLALIVGCLMWSTIFKKPSVQNEPNLFAEYTKESETLNKWGYTTDLFEQIKNNDNLTKIIKELPTNGTFDKYKSHQYDEETKTLSIEYSKTTSIEKVVFKDQLLENNAYLLFYMMPECEIILMNSTDESLQFNRELSVEDFDELYTICANNLSIPLSEACVNQICIGDYISDIFKQYQREPELMKSVADITLYQIYSTTFYANPKGVVVGFKTGTAWSEDLGVKVNREEDLNDIFGPSNYSSSNKLSIRYFELNGINQGYLFYEFVDGVVQDCGIVLGQDLLSLATGDFWMSYGPITNSQICYLDECNPINSLSVLSFNHFTELTRLKYSKPENELARFIIEYDESILYRRDKVVEYVYYDNHIVKIGDYYYSIDNWNEALNIIPEMKELLAHNEKYLSSHISDTMTFDTFKSVQKGSIKEYKFKNSEKANEFLEILKSMIYVEMPKNYSFETIFSEEYILNDGTDEISILSQSNNLTLSQNGTKIFDISAQILDHRYSIISSYIEADHSIVLSKSFPMYAELYNFEDSDIKFTTTITKGEQINSYSKEQLNTVKLNDLSQFEISIDGKQIDELPYSAGSIFTVLFTGVEADKSYTYRFIYKCM